MNTVVSLCLEGIRAERRVDISIYVYRDTSICVVRNKLLQYLVYPVLVAMSIFYDVSMTLEVRLSC
jgi:hypothetical protein